MGMLKKQIHEIQDDIALSVLSFAAIAKKNNVTFDFVQMVWDEMCKKEAEKEGFNG